MAQVLIRRIILVIPMLFGVSVLIFAIIRLVPGDPVLAVLGLHATPEQAAALRAQLRLDDPIHVQYVHWLGDALRGDFGYDYRSGEPISTRLANALPVTVQLAVMSMTLAILIGVTVGVLAAVFRGRIVDRLGQGLSMVGISIPDFWLGIMLILVFALGLGVLPSSGYIPLADDPIASVRHLLLPALALAAGLSAVLIRITRVSMLQVLEQDYVRFARSKGIPESKVVVKHSVRNASIPVVTILGMQAGYLLGGAIVVEQVFALPGVGRLVLDAVLQRNYPLAQAAILVITLMFILANLIADLLYGVLNPRLRGEPA